MKILNAHYLDDEWNVSGTDEEQFRSLIKDVSETTYTKVISPENFLIYSLLGFRKIKEQAFKVAIIDPDFATIGVLLPNSKGCYFSDKNKNIGLMTFEQLRKAGITDNQIQEIENEGFLLQYRTEKRTLTLLPSKMLLATLCRQLGIGKLNSGPEPLRDIYLASQMNQKKKFKMVYRKYQGNAKAFACFGPKYYAEPQTIVLDIIERLREQGFTDDISIKQWSVCHSNTIVNLEFTKMAQEFEDMKITPGVRLTTSDIGDSSYTLENFLSINDNIVILKDLVARKHTSELEVDVFVKHYIKEAFPSIVLIMSRIKKLDNVRVDNKKKTVLHLLEKAQFFHVLGIKNSTKVKEFLKQLPEGSCTGKNVIIEVLQIPGHLKELNIEHNNRIAKSIGSIFSFDLIKEIYKC